MILRRFLAIIVWCAICTRALCAGPISVPAKLRPALPSSSAAPQYNWVFSGFQDSGGGTEHLQINYSQDGINWSNTGNVYAAPSGNGVRDPSIICINQVYYVAYTAGIFGNVGYCQICRSTDLVNWTYLCDVSTAGVYSGGYTWAPDWFIDHDGTVYLYVACSEAGGTWRVFYSTATSLDLTGWSAFQPVGGDMPSRGAIDPHVFRDGDSYYLLYRNYGGGGGTDCIEMAKGTSPAAFSLYETGDWAGWGSPREGPSLVNLGGSNWRIYYNNLSVYGDPNYYSDSTDDLATWSTPNSTSLITGHGTVLPLTSSATEPFDVFLYYYGLTGVDPGVDFNHDGISDLLEFVLGGNPVTPDASILPSVSYATSGAAPCLVYSFNSVADLGSTTWTVETSSDLVNWAAAVAGVNGVTISTTPADSVHNHNVVTIPNPGGGSLFARLRATLPAVATPGIDKKVAGPSTAEKTARSGQWKQRGPFRPGLKQR
jgi:hypothetical protein